MSVLEEINKKVKLEETGERKNAFYISSRLNYIIPF